MAKFNQITVLKIFFMEAFISIKGLFEANSRDAIQSHLRKISWIFCFLLSIQISSGQGETMISQLRPIKLNYQGISVSKSKSVNQLNVANRLISGRVANIVTPTVTISTDNTRLAEGQTSTITATLSVASSS
jgi:hypothetical protein